MTKWYQWYQPYSMTIVTGPILGGLAFIGAFNDIGLIHIIWLSLVFVLSQVVLVWLQNERGGSPPAPTRFWSIRQVLFILLGFGSLLYTLAGALFHIPFNITAVDIGAAALIAAMGFAHQSAESENRKWKVLLFRAMQERKLTAEDLQFLRLVLSEE